MKRTSFPLLLALVLQACSGQFSQAPTTPRRDLPAGAMGQIDSVPQDWIEGETTWWIDSDGVEPGIAGCHIGTDSGGSSNGRMFGEFCVSQRILAETVPGAGVLHRHENDISRPGQIDCAMWCAGNGSAGGKCEVAEAPPCTQSARCVCN